MVNPGRQVTLEANGIVLRGELYLPAAGPPHPAVCLCHGIPAEAHDPADRGYRDLAEKVVTAGMAAFIFNFRGCGLSGGNFDMSGWREDLKAVVSYLAALPELDGGRLALCGFSGGAAVAADVAAGDGRVQALALCACPAEFRAWGETGAAELIARYRDIGVIRDDGFPADPEAWMRGFATLRPVDIISRISPRPVLIAHGTADDVVPAADAESLYDGALEPKELRLIPGAGHRLRREQAAVDGIITWLKEALR